MQLPSNLQKKIPSPIVAFLTIEALKIGYLDSELNGAVNIEPSYIQVKQKLGGVRPVDNRPSTNYLDLLVT